MNILVAVLVSLLIGFLAYLLATIFPFSAAYAPAIGLVVAILAFLSSYSKGWWNHPQV